RAERDRAAAGSAARAQPGRPLLRLPAGPDCRLPRQPAAAAARSEPGAGRGTGQAPQDLRPALAGSERRRPPLEPHAAHGPAPPPEPRLIGERLGGRAVLAHRGLSLEAAILLGACV